ncbi:MAG: autotransporter-associated beta strand repeat-containing protein [Pirellulaceae bacterium]|nr:autotransporter-associated beta strand repeat-containing protein [Pirellulaceae bacterium]
MTLRNLTAARPINLGTETAGSLSLTDAELDRITAGTLRIGDANSGTMTISSPITITTASTLALRSAGNIIKSNFNDGLAVANFRAQAAAVSMQGNNSVSQVAGIVGSGGFYFGNTSPLTVGSVDGASGITTTGGGQVYLNASSVAVSTGIRSTGTVTLQGNDVEIGAAVHAPGQFVSIQPRTSGRLIDVGVETAGRLSLTDAELDLITGHSVSLGDGGAAGNILVAAPITAPAGWDTLRLLTNGTITQSGAGTLAVSRLELFSQSGISLTNPGNSIGTLSAQTTADPLALSNSTNLAIGNVLGLSGIATGGGDVSIAAPNLNITHAINAGSGSVSLVPPAATAIDLGGSSPGQLGLTDAELDLITTGVLRIGDASSGAISVTSSISPGGTSVLRLSTGSTISSSGGAILETSVALVAAGGVDLPGSGNSITNLAGSTSGALFNVGDGGGSVHISTVDGLAGISTSGGVVIVTAHGASSLTVSQPVNAGDKDVTFSANNIAINAAVSAGSQTATLRSPNANRPISLGTEVGGALSLTDEELDRITAGTLRIGDASSGTITISSPISVTTATTLRLNTGANVTQSASLAANDLAVDAVGEVYLGFSSNSVATVALHSATDRVVVGDNNGFAVGDVDGLAGVSAASAVGLAAYGGQLAINANVTGTNLSMYAYANEGAITFAVGTLTSGSTADIGADKINLLGQISTSSITTLRSMNNDGVDLGSTADTATNTLELSDAELDRITASLLQIGNASTASIQISAPITHGNHLKLTSSGQVTINHSVTMAPDKDFSATGQTGIVLNNSNADLVASGVGWLTLETPAGIVLSPGSSITTQNGDLNLRANQQPTPTVGGAHGIGVYSATVQATGSGNVLVKGRALSGGGQLGVTVQSGGVIRGGTSGTVTVVGTGGITSGSNHGVYVVGSGSTITSVGSGTVSVQGTAGAGYSGFNLGIYVLSSASITSGGGNISVTGAGAGSSSGFNHGVYVAGSSSISAPGSGNVSVQGIGGAAPGNRNLGVVVEGSSTTISSAGGNVSVTGTGGGSSSSYENYGVLAGSGGSIRSTAGGTVTVVGSGGTGSNGSNLGTYNVGTISSTTGDVSVTGTGGGSGNNNYGLYNAGGTITAGGTATVTLQGTGATTGAVSNYGVYLASGTVSAGGGDLIITGQGNGNVSGGYSNYGVYNSIPLSVGGAGSITIHGTGGASSGGSNYGVYSSGNISTANGNISVTGMGGGSGSSSANYGARLYGTISAGGAGTVDIQGTGGATSGSFNYGLEIGGSVLTNGGNATIVGQGGGVATGSDNYGIRLSGTYTAASPGTVSIQGTGGATTGPYNYGVVTTGTISLNRGTISGLGGGSGSSSYNYGVYVQHTISSSSSDVTVQGTGGATAGANNFGVYVLSATVTAGSTGAVTVTGTGGGGTGSGNSGVFLYYSLVTSNGGNVSVTGDSAATGTGGSNVGVHVTGGSAITAGGSGTVTVEGTGAASSGAGNHGVYVLANGATTYIGLGAGNVTVNGSGGGTGTSSANHGVYLDGSTGYLSRIGAYSNGSVQVTGTGGNGSGGSHYGVYVRSYAVISSANANVTVAGTGGEEGGTNLGVLLQGGAYVAAGGAGATSIHGTGGVGSGHNNHGILVETSSQIASSSSGTVSVAGQGGGAGSSGFNVGVFLQTGGRLNANTSAAVTVAGAGGATDGANNHGVYVNFGAGIEQFGPGGLTVTGDGGGTGVASASFGVIVQNSSRIRGANAATGVTVQGAGTGTGGLNHGIDVSGGTSEVSSINGLLTVTGIAGAGGSGLRVLSGTTVRTTGTGNILVTADSATIGGGTINAGANTVTVRPATAGTQIHLGGADSAGVLGLTDAELDLITAGTLRIGDANSGAVLVDQPVTITNAGTLHIITGANVNQNAPLAVANLAVEADGELYLGFSSNDVDTVALHSVTDRAIFGDSDGFVVGTVDGVVGAVAASTVGLAAYGGDLAVQANVAGQNVNLYAYGNGNFLTIAGGVVVTGVAGDIGADRMNLLGTFNMGSGPAYLRSLNDDAIDLGSTTDAAANTLELSDAELDRVTAGTLVIGGTSGGSIAVSANITHSAATAMQLLSGGDIAISGGQIDTAGGTLLLDSGNSPAAVRPTKSDVDVSASALSFGSDLAIAINGTAVDTQYTQLKVAGAVDLTGVTLVLSGSYTPAVDDSFVIVDNDGTDAVLGTFTGLPEGSVVVFNGRDLQVSYQGGDGNDIVLTALPLTFVWDGGGNGTSWLDPLNWDRDMSYPNGVGDEAVFPDLGFSISANVGTPVTVGKITIANSANVSIFGSAITLDAYAGNAEIRFDTDSVHGISAPLVLADDLDFRGTGVNAGIGSAISGNYGIRKLDGGRLRVSGNNSFLGTATIVQGQVWVENANALGSTAGGTIVEAAGILSLARGSSTPLVVAERITLNGGRLNGSPFGVAASYDLSFTGSIEVTADSKIDISHSNPATLRITGPVSGGANLEINGDNQGVVALSGSNSLTGTTTIGRTSSMAGTVRLDAANAVSPSSTYVVLETFDLNNFNATIGALQGSGTVALGSGALTTGANDASTSFSGTLSGTGSVTKTGAGIWTLSGPNTYGGSTTVSGGTVKLGVANVIPNNSSVVLANAAGVLLDLNGYGETIGSLSGGGPLGGNVSLGSGTLATGNDDTSTSFAGVISGSGQLSKLGSGTFTLSGANTYTGYTNVFSPGVLRLGANNVLSDATRVNPQSGATFDLNGFSDTIGALDIGSGTVTNNGGASSTLTVGGNGHSGSFPGTIASGTGVISLAKIGSGTQTLGGNNSYTGQTVVNDGVLSITHANALGTPAGATTVETGAVLEVSNLGTVAEPLILNGGTVRSAAGSGAPTFTGGATLNADSFLQATPGFNGMEFQTAPITGTGGLTITAGQVRLSSPNSYDGVTSIQSGAHIIFHDAAALGSSIGGTEVAAGASLWMSGVFTVTGEALTLNGGSLQASSGPNGWSGPIDLAASSSIHAYSGNTLTIGGPVSGAGGLTTNGPGVVVLAGTSNYAGATQVTNGTLRVDGSIVSAVTVASSARLAGSGSTGDVTANSGGTVAPGNSPGVLNTGNAEFAAGSTFEVEINGPAPGAGGHDQLNVTGTVTIASGALLNVSLGYTPAVGDEIVIINNDDADAVVGEFDGFADGSTVTIGGFDFEIDYQGGDGNDVTLTALPMTFVWDGGDADDANWMSPDNWVGDVAPAPGHRLEFAGNVRMSNTNNFPNDTSFASIEFAVHGFSVSGNRLALDETQGLAITVAPGAATWFTIPLAGDGDLLKSGGGQLILQAANTYTGQTTINAGSINLASSGTLGAASGGTVVQSGATLNILGTVPVLDNITVSGIGFTGFGAVNGNNNAVLAGNLTLAGDTRIATFGATSPFTITGNISDGGNGFGLEIRGSEVARTIVLAGINTYTGPTSLLEPVTLRLEGGSAISNGSAVTLAAGSVLDLNGFDETIGSLAGSGTVVLGTRTLTTGGNNQSTTFSGSISSVGGFTNVVKEGSGTFTLSGTNAYSGTTLINAGTLRVVGGSAIADSAAVQTAGSGVFEVGASETIGGLYGSAGSVQLPAGTMLTVAPPAATNSSYNGVIGGPGSLMLAGGANSGWTLGGINTYTGTTDVLSGTLRVTGTIGAGGPADTVTVGNGAALAGTGTIHADVVATGGSISPGTSPGVLTIDGDLNLAGGLLSAEVNGTTAGSGYDQLVVTGTVDISAATLTATGSISSVSPGTPIVIVDHQGAGAVAGTFAGLPSGAVVAVNGETFRIFYNGGDGNDVVLLRDFDVLPTVLVDDDWAGLPAGTEVEPGAYYRLNAFDVIQDAINTVDPGGEVVINAGNYLQSNTTINKHGLTVRGATGTAGDVKVLPSGASHGLIIGGNDAVIRNLFIADGSHGIFANGVHNLTVVNVESTSNNLDGLRAINTTGTITIEGGWYHDNAYDGLHLVNIQSVVLASGVTSTSNRAGLVVETAASFQDIDGVYSNNDHHGIQLVDISGDVTLIRTTLENNDADNNGTGDGLNATDGGDGDNVAIGGDLLVQGATIRDTDGAAAGKHQIRGVYVQRLGGSATFEDAASPAQSVTVSGHAQEGLLIYHGTGATLSNGTYHGNRGPGINLQSFGGQIEVTDVTVTSNAVGAVFQTSAGNVSINGGSFTHNTYQGLNIIAYGSPVELTGVAASHNGNVGMQLGAAASLQITDSSFQANARYGIAMGGIVGAVTFVDVTAVGNRNDSGIRIESAGSFSDTDGVYSNNDKHGIELLDIAGDVTLIRTTLENNDANNDGIGDGLNAMDSVDANSVSIGGKFEARSTVVRDTDGPGGTVHQQSGFVIGGLAGDLYIYSAVGGGANVFSGHAADGVRIDNFGGGWSLIRGTYANNAGIGFDVNGATGTLQFDMATFAGNGKGIEISDAATVFFSDSTLDGNANGGSVTNVSDFRLSASTGDVDLNTAAISGEGHVRRVTSSVPHDVLEYTGVADLTVNTYSGNDTVNVAPHTTTVLHLDGGNPTTAPGDTLNFTAGSLPHQITSSQILTAGHANIHFVNFETIAETGNSLLIGGTDGDDTLEITATGPDSGSYVLTIDGVAGPAVSFLNIASLTFNGLDGHDILRIHHPAGGVFAPAGGIVFDGGPNTTAPIVNPPGDSLEILGGLATSVEHEFASANDGAIYYNGEANAAITYSGLEPITDTTIAADRIFTFSGGSETITLSDDAVPGRSRIDSTLGESVSFLNPTGSLIVDTSPTAGADTLVVDGLDAVFDANVTITAKGAEDDVVFSGAIDLGDNHLTVANTRTITVSGSLTTAAGMMALNASRNIVLQSGSSVTTVDGSIFMVANSGGSTSGNFAGISAANATVQTTGSGNIALAGFGGDAGADNIGIHLHSGTSVRSTASGSNAGTVSLSGFGGTGTNFNRGIVVEGTTTQVTSVDGDIAILGLGGTGTGDGMHGIDLRGQVISSGTGPHAAAITLTGAGGSASTTSPGQASGVIIQSFGGAALVQSVDGAISIGGQGGTGNTSRGVQLLFGADVIATGSASIDIFGTGGSAANNNNGVGVFIFNGDSRVQTTAGNITITGTGASSPSGYGSNGLSIYSGGAVSTTSGGNVTLTAHAGPGSIQDALVIFGSTALVETSGGGEIVLNTDSLMLTGSVTSDSAVTIAPITPGREINLGTEDDDRLSLTDAELDQITADVLRIGNATAGLMIINGHIDTAGTDTLHLISGTVVVGQSVVTEPNLAVQAPDGILMNGNNAVGVVALHSSNGHVVFAAAGDLEIGQVDGQSGVAALNGDVNLVAQGGLLVGNTQQTRDVEASGNVFLSALGDGNLLAIAAGAVVHSTGGMHIYTADKMQIDGQIDATGQRLTLKTRSAGDAIDLGSTTDAAHNTLELSDAELDRISAAVIQVGDSNAGPIAITGHIDTAGTDTLRLCSGASVTQSPGIGSIAEPNLAVQAVGDITMNFSNAVDVVALRSNNGNIVFAAGGDLIIGQADLQFGVAAANGNVNVSSQGGLLVSSTPLARDVEAGGTLHLSALGNDNLLKIASGAVVYSTGGQHIYTADKMQIDGQIDASGQRVTLKTRSAGEAIDLGSTTDLAADTLELSAAELDLIAAAVIQVGDSDVGSIAITAHIDTAETDTLRLYSGASVTQSPGSGSITEPNLAVHATGHITMDAGNAVEVVALRSTNGNIAFAGDGVLEIGQADLQFGVVAINGNVHVVSQGSLLVSDTPLARDVEAGGNAVLHAIDSSGIGDDLTIASGATIFTHSGDIVLRAGDDLLIDSGATVAAGGSVELAADFAAAETLPAAVALTVRGLVTNVAPSIATAGNGNDAITFQQKGAGRINVDAGAGDDTYHLLVGEGTLSGRVHFADTSGTDQLNVTATAAADELWIDFLTEAGVGTIVTAADGGFTGGSGTFTSSIEYLNVFGGDGEDTFHVQPSASAGTEIFIDGGAPSFGDAFTTGDVLDFDPLGHRFQVTCDAIETNPGGTPAFELVRFRDIEGIPLGENSGNLGTTEWSFDFDPTGAVVTQAGYDSVAPGMLYDGINGNLFGWRTAVTGFDRGGGLTSEFGNLLRDGHWQSASRTFTAEVTNGWYLVSIKTGDRSFARDHLRVTDADSGTILVEGLSTAAGQFATRTFLVEVTDGTMDLAFSDGGGDPYWAVNGLDIRPGRILTIGSPPQPTLTADGISQTLIEGYRATGGQLVTVSAHVDTDGDGVPDGPAQIATPDADPDLAGVQVRANDAFGTQYPGKPEGYFEYTLVHPSQPGTVTVKLEEVSGDQAGCLSIQLQAPGVRRFDFNAPGSPTQTPVSTPAQPLGYIGVLPSDLNSPSVGYGWVTSPSSYDRGAQAGSGATHLLRDGAWASGPREFRVQLPVGAYEVTVTFGDPSFARDQMNVTLTQGSSADLSSVTNVSTSAGQAVHRTFTAVTNIDGELVFQFSNGGGDPYWNVAALEVRGPLTVENGGLFSIASPGGIAPADGASVMDYEVSGATVGAVYTISATGGALVVDIDGVAVADADPRYAGVQIVAVSSNFNLGVRSPSSSGDVNVQVVEVTGASRGSAQQTYALPPVRRFDFDGSGVATQQNPDFTSVRASALYNPANGYGWVTSPGEIQRSGTGILEAWPSLYRDGHWQSGSGTFQVQVEAGQTYDVRVYTGDQSFTRDQLQITVEGAAGPVVVPLTAANKFAKVTIPGGQDTNNDGRLNITFTDLGGDPYWVVNGLDVALTGSLPELPPTSVVSVAVNNDIAPESAAETVTFTVGLDVAQPYPITVAYTIGGTATPSTDFINAGGDYSSLNSGTITFSPGQTSKTIRFQVVDEALIEDDETVIVTLSSPAGATLGAPSSVAHTIENDDFPPPLPTSRSFDFGSSSSPLDPAFTQVGDANAYNSTLRYGWQTAASAFNRSGPTALLQDGHWGTNNTFLVDIPNGDYVVNVTLGDASFARNNISVWGEGILQHSGLGTAAGQFLHRSFVVTVADNQLNVQIASTGGDPYFTINALEIFPAQEAPESPQFNHDLQTTDGVTFTGTSNAPDGSFVTVSTSLGSITSADANTSYVGTQVVVNSGSFTFTVAGPGGGGLATISSEEVTGKGKGTVAHSYAMPTVRRFDFNGSANDTELTTSPVFTGVRGTSLYDANNGYGWTQTVSEFQRASAAKTSVALYRDGHWGSSMRTFQVAADDSKTYSVRVYVGDASFARDKIQASSDGLNWVTMNPVTIGANVFATISLTNASPSAGKLNISIRDNGGDPYWTVNGIDVWESTATDPGESPLLAGVWSSEMVGGQLTQAAVDAVLPAAREYWVSTGLSDVQLAELYRTPIAIGDLSYRGALGVSKPEGIWLDASGAGLGWSLGSGQWSVVSGIPTTANGQLPTAAYDLLTVVTHELGHAIGYGDLDPHHHPDDIMSGVLQPGTGRVDIAASVSDSEFTTLFGPAASGRGPQWVAGAERDSGITALIGPAAGGRGPLVGGRGPLVVDRVLDELLRDDLRVSDRALGREVDDELELLAIGHNSEQESEIDDFFAQL